jgi:hypothetical protein
MSYEKKDNGVVMLEQTTTRDEEMLKSTPMVGKVDYSGAYEVRTCITFTATTMATLLFRHHLYCQNKLTRW